MTPGRDGHAKPDTHAHDVHGLVLIGLPDGKGPHHEQRLDVRERPVRGRGEGPRAFGGRLPRPVKKLFLILA